MSTLTLSPFSWHSGERQMHNLTHLPRHGEDDNPTVPFLAPRYAVLAARYPLMVCGVVDDDHRDEDGHGNVWCTIFSGPTPFTQQVGKSILAIKAVVDGSFDPVVQALFRKGKEEDGGGEYDKGDLVVREEGRGRLWSGLTLDLESRGRVKFAGRVVGGVLSGVAGEGEGGDGGKNVGKKSELQLVVKVEQSLGNCPKYLNKKKIVPVTPRPSPTLVESGAILGPGSLELVAKADLFAVTSANGEEDMDANHRGGPAGFLRAVTKHENGEATQLVWPEYSGNNLYQTLGNLMTTPHAGLCIPDFDTGDVLYVTGRTEVLQGKEAEKLIDKSNLAVRLTVVDSRFVKDGLGFKGEPTDDGKKGMSPYNPRVRLLASEKAEGIEISQVDTEVTAKLIKKTKLAPTMNRYRFALSDPDVLPQWKPGQYVTLDFNEELNMGYEHMNDADPQSLNDDYLRTFTVSSVPGTLGQHGEEFEITIRNVGKVTGWLSGQREGMVEVGVKEFGGDFKFDMSGSRRVAFIAGGVGITPLMGQMGDLDVKRFNLIWSAGMGDVGIVVNLLEEYPSLQERTQLFLTGDEAVLKGTDDEKKLQKLKEMKIELLPRRLTKEDLAKIDGEMDDWYLCTAPGLRKRIQEWLPSRAIIFESFNY